METNKNIWHKITDALSVELSEKSLKWLFWGVLLLGITLRLANWYFEPILARDAIGYIHLSSGWAENGDDFLLNDGSFLVRNPPLLWGVMRQMILLGISPEIGGLLFCLICGSLIPVVIYHIGQTLFGKRELALAGMLIGACHPALVELSKEIIRDAPYLLFAGAAIALMLTAMKEKKIIYWLWSGLAFGVALLCRYETLELGLIPAIYFLCRLKVGKWREVAYGALSIVGGIMIAVVLLTWLLGVPPEVYQIVFIERFFGASEL